MPMKLSDYVFQRLAATGVRHVFMLPGGGCMHLCDSLGRAAGLEFICNLHEQGSAIAADAYGQYTNHLGVALVTTGPGGTNTLTGVAAAWLDSTPCLFLSGQVKRADLKGDRPIRQLGFQEIDIVRLVEPITKYAVTVTDPATIRYHLDQALYLARHGRPGPVWLDIPLDVQAADIAAEALPGFEPPLAAGAPGAAALAHAVERTVALLAEAQRPVLLLGNGVRLDRAQASLTALLETLPVPVLLSWKAIDFLPEEHPLYVGRPGAVGQRGANFALQNADLLIAVGARLDYGQIGYDHRQFCRAARKVIVDVDPGEIAKLNLDVEVPLASRAQPFLDALQRAWEQRGVSAGFGSWLERCKDWQQCYPVVLPEYWTMEQGLSNYAFINLLSTHMDAGDLLVPGSSGACSEITMQAFRVKSGQRIFNSEGLGPMGFGIPAAIGACLASDRRRTVCVDGDGGFVMNIQELEVVRRLNLPIKFFVLDNDGYGSIRQTQKTHFDSRFVACDPTSGLTLPDLRRVAEAFQIPATEIESTTDAPATLRRVLEAPGPALCLVNISPQHQTAPRLASRALPDGRMVSTPIEDLWPFLDRQEFQRNMLVPVLDNMN